jgi:hypothetical protein
MPTPEDFVARSPVAALAALAVAAPKVPRAPRVPRVVGGQVVGQWI